MSGSPDSFAECAPRVGKSVLTFLRHRCRDVSTRVGAPGKDFIWSLLLGHLPSLPPCLSFFPPITQDTVSEMGQSFVGSYSLASLLLCTRHCVRHRGDARGSLPWSPPSWGSVQWRAQYRSTTLHGGVVPRWCWGSSVWSSRHSSSAVPMVTSQPASLPIWELEA